jgi:hypothetical protein
VSKLDYPATQRNREPLWGVLQRVLPERGVVLEVASGSGQHAAFFAAQRRSLHWQPSSYEPEERASIDAYAAEQPNMAPALELDVLQPWPIAAAAAVVCCNMIHIAPWACTPALMRGAAGVLGSGSPLVLYGPFHVDGRPTSDSNAAFDASLRARDPSWGVRDREAVVTQAEAAGLQLDEIVPMPANNQTLIFRRS